MIRVQNKLNVPNIVCGVRLRPFGAKVLDCSIQNKEIQEKIKCGSICVVDMQNADVNKKPQITEHKAKNKIKDNGIIAIDEGTPIVVQEKPTTTKRKRKPTNSTTSDK